MYFFSLFCEIKVGSYNYLPLEKTLILHKVIIRIKFKIKIKITTAIRYFQKKAQINQLKNYHKGFCIVQ